MKNALALIAALIPFTVFNTAAADTLNICFEKWEPFHYSVDGGYKGLQIELNDKALAILGHTAIYKELPYARCIEGVRKGDFDAVLLSSSEEPLVPTAVETVFWEIGLVARSDWASDSYASLSEFDDAKVGLVSTYAYDQAITEASKKWKVRKSADAVANLRKVGAGRLDLTVVDIPWSQLIAKRENLKIRILSPVLQSYPQYTYFNPGKSSYAGPLSAALQKLHDDGSVDALYKLYLNESFADAKARNSSTFLE